MTAGITAKTSPPGVRRWVVDLRRALRWHRRKLAVLATLAAVLTGLTALAPQRPPTVSVVTAARSLAGGTTIAVGDIAETSLPPDAVPEGAWTDPAEVVGRVLAGPVPAGQVLTATALLRHRAARAHLVVAPLSLADPKVAGLLTAGDQVDVLAADSETGKTRRVAAAVRIVAGAVGATDEASATTGLVLVEVSPDTATALASAASTSVLSVVWR